MTEDPRLAFVGGVTIYQGGRKFDAEATLFAEGAAPAWSFFGHYRGVTPDGLTSGGATIRFSDGSEATASLVAVDSDAGGFRINGYLQSTGTRRDFNPT